MDNSMADPELEAAVARYATYDDYLDSMVTSDDLMFLQDNLMPRELVRLGYRSNKKVVTQKDFEKRKAEIEIERLLKRAQRINLYSEGVSCPELLMQELAKREKDNLTGFIATIVFLRDTNNKDEEVSAYIDYRYRLEMEDWKPYFMGKKRLAPLTTDLSFHNWDKEDTYCNSSPNFDAVADQDIIGLHFICKKDMKPIIVNTKGEDNGDATTRFDLEGTDYKQVVIFDHLIKKRIN